MRMCHDTEIEMYILDVLSGPISLAVSGNSVALAGLHIVVLTEVPMRDAV